MIYWANPAYWPYFPDSLYDRLILSSRLADGLAYHFFFMWFFFINGVLYTIYVVASGQWREIIPRLKPRGQSEPPAKFNNAQRFAYSGVVVMGFLSVVSGLAIYKPIQLSPLTILLGGYESARLIHYVLTVLYVLFFVIHVLQVARAGWNTFAAMITGFEIMKRPKP